jgi:multidrug efflux pump subunit AcrA (membrane-fusion protein)
VYEVTGSVSDALVNEIAVGQSAEVVAAGSTNAVAGKVTGVAEEATVSSGVATFPVTVVLSGASPSLRPGMSASVSVVINRVVQVITVPTSAVHTTGAGSTVTLMVNGKPVSTAVTVGAADASRTQILSGVKVGDQVVIATISSTIPSSTSGTGRSLTGGGFGGGGFGGGGGGGGAGRIGG